MSDVSAETIIHNAKTIINEDGLIQSHILPNDQVGSWFNNWRRQDQSPSVKTLRLLADALHCDIGYLMRDIIPDRPPPRENRREYLDLLTINGSGMEAVFLLWTEFQGRLCPGFVKSMDRLDLWKLSQLYDYEDGLFIYGFMGCDQIRWFGQWALEAPGQILGENDPDRAFADWTAEIYRRIVEEQKPLRYACEVRNSYQGEPVGLPYDAIYLPLLSDDKLKVLMVARTMEVLFDGIR